MAQMGLNKPKTWHKEKLRLLTPIEWERLQTVPDNYTSCVSNNRRRHMLGNGWTVDVIAHIFKGINEQQIEITKEPYNYFF
jgi:site-specific DNA-cytosine methylase